MANNKPDVAIEKPDLVIKEEPNVVVTKIDFNNLGNVDRGSRVVKPEIPIGIKTPIRRGPRHGLFDMNVDILEQIKDNFKNLLLTNHDERVVNTTIGASLRPLLFENASNVNEEVTTQIAINIKDAVGKYMPYIKLQSLEILVNETDARIRENFARVIISFSIEGLLKDNQVAELDLFLRA